MERLTKRDKEGAYFRLALRNRASVEDAQTTTAIFSTRYASTSQSWRTKKNAEKKGATGVRSRPTNSETRT